MLRKNLPLIASLLCILVLLPQFLIATSTTIEREHTIIEVETMTNVKSMVVLNTTLVVNEFIKVEYWSNGSKTIHISEHFILNDPTCREVWVNMTQTISPSLLLQSSIPKTKLVQPLGIYPGKYTWDELWFLPKGNNGTHIVEYTHDDNFDTYWPGQWFTAWELKGKQFTHVHIPAQDITDWMNRVKTRSDILAIIFGLLGGGLTVIAGIMSFFECPLAAVPAIIGGVSAIIAALLALLGITEYNWIRDVVQTWYGDGFVWVGSVFKYLSLDWWYSPYWTRPITVWSFYEHREWQMRWGAERDNPQSYHAKWWSHDEIKTGPASVTTR